MPSSEEVCKKEMQLYLNDYMDRNGMYMLPYWQEKYKFNKNLSWFLRRRIISWQMLYSIADKVGCFFQFYWQHSTYEMTRENLMGVFRFVYRRSGLKRKEFIEKYKLNEPMIDRLLLAKSSYNEYFIFFIPQKINRGQNIINLFIRKEIDDK